MKFEQVSREILEELNEIRLDLQHGDKTTQNQLNQICKDWQKYRELLRPNEKDEVFNLVDHQGNFSDLTIARWLCHLLGLRHMSVHVLLRWQSPSLGCVFILQVRNWTKSDSPGHLDISVGGHVVGNKPSISIESAYREMEEELGIVKSDLQDDKLVYKNGYESSDEREKDNFYNTEWREVYLGEITTSGFNKIRFSDNEVVGIYLCPESEAKNLLNQKYIPMASALKLSLPKCL